MYRTFKTKVMVLAFVSVCMLAATANAACGDSNKFGAMLHRQSWQISDELQPGSLLSISDSRDPIVGMWHVTFTAHGNELGPPDDTPIDNALVTWHSDGTELMNSARPPQDGDFCMGVWKKAGKSTYKLNHIAWLSNDTANAPTGIGNPTGPTRFFEEVTLSPDGKALHRKVHPGCVRYVRKPGRPHRWYDRCDPYHSGYNSARFALTYRPSEYAGKSPTSLDNRGKWGAHKVS